MSDYVVIRLAADDQPVEWVAVDSDGTRHSGVSSGNLEQAAVAAAEKPVIVLVPSADILITSVNIPARSATKIRAALPFALEENLAEDVEDLHFAMGERRNNNRVTVAIVAVEKLTRWLSRLNAAGIQPVILTADNQGLAKIPGTLSVLVDGDTVMFNDGDDAEFTLQDVKPSEALVIAGHLGETQQEDDEKIGAFAGILHARSGRKTGSRLDCAAARTAQC